MLGRAMRSNGLKKWRFFFIQFALGPESLIAFELGVRSIWVSVNCGIA